MTDEIEVDEGKPSRRRGDARRDPELWAALDEGRLLRAILEDFYEGVFTDPVIGRFFAQTTKEWVIDHQYAFLAQAWSGTQQYFGDRPRNAHHWMVISDAEFDHREELLVACLRRHGLAERHVEAWRSLDESFRSHIVKDRPFPKKRAGKALPLDGFEPLVLSAGGVCDGCTTEIAVDAVAHYHVRTGRTLCGACRETAGD